MKLHCILCALECVHTQWSDSLSLCNQCYTVCIQFKPVRWVLLEWPVSVSCKVIFRLLWPVLGVTVVRHIQKAELNRSLVARKLETYIMDPHEGHTLWLFTLGPDVTCHWPYPSPCSRWTLFSCILQDSPADWSAGLPFFSAGYWMQTIIMQQRDLF